MNKTHYSLNEVSKIVGVKAHRIAYAISNGYLPEPAQRVTNRRLFSTADLQAAMIYFAKRSNLGRPPAKEGDR
jgi:DNA-binding transcriptional MerR regulator